MKIKNACICWNQETKKIRSLSLPCGDDMRRFNLTDDVGACQPVWNEKPTDELVRTAYAIVLNLIGQEIVNPAEAYEALLQIDECARELRCWLK